MRGTVRVYQGYDEKPIFEESNLIVDGFKEHIVDIMTRVPAPSAVSADVSASYTTSNFTVQAMSFSPNGSNFDRIHSLACLSGYVDSASLTSLDPGDSNAWSYREDIENPQFSAVNWRGTPATNSILRNGLFSRTRNYFKNTTFKDYNLNLELPGIYINEFLSLYELPNWEILSDLRFNPSSNEFESTYRYGSCARYDMGANLPVVSSIYAMLSGTEASSTYAEPDDGILYIRSFSPSSAGADSSGAVTLRQTASVYSPYMEPWASIEDETALDMLAEIRFQFSSTVGLDGAEIHVRVKDLVQGDYYNFSPTSRHDRHTWGSGGSSLVVDASAGLSGTVSKFINLPQSRVKHPLQVSYSFYSKGTSDRLECYFWNPGLRIVEDWYIGNIAPEGDIATVSGNAFRSPGMFIDLSNVDADLNATDLSNVTYISQLANMAPSKIYSYVFNVEQNTNAAGNDYMRAAVLKRYTSNMSEQGRYNLLTTNSASALNETRLTDAIYAVSPELHRDSILTEFDGQNALVRPSDLCLHVSSYITGSFSCSANRPFIFEGEVCKNFDNGLSAAPVGFILETSGLNSNGQRLKFNFETGNWVPSGAGTVLDSSSVFSFGRFSPFESRTIDPISLIAEGVPLNSDGAFDFTLTVSALSNKPAFVKSLRMNSLAIPTTQQKKELFLFSNIFNTTKRWGEVVNNTNIFDGFTVGNVAPYTTPNFTGVVWNTINQTAPLAGMNVASGSIHSDETTYQFIICRDTVSRGTAAGEMAKVTGAYCTDAALTVTPVDVDLDIFTSELYFNAHRRDIVDEPYMMINCFSSLYDNSDALSALPFPFVLFDGSIPYWSEKPNALWIYANTVPQSTASTALCHSFNYKDLTLPVSSEGMAFSFEYNTAYDAAGNPVKWLANANTSSGKIVHWNATTSSWAEAKRGEEPNNDFAYTIAIHGSTNVKFTRTPVIDISNQDFDDDTVITFSIVLQNVEAQRLLMINDWRFYNVTASAMFDLGAFPAPEETTVQPISLPAGRLGQFTNNIEINSSGISEARALGSANWAPDPDTSALAADSVGTIASTHNIGGCVNSDGFVYSGQADSDGFNLSGYTVTTTVSSIKHTIDLSATDVNFFDLQGGIGAMGLWAFDIDKTYAKLLDNGYNLSAIYDQPGASGELYNVTDIDRNPVFKLLAKKVFRQPITIASGLTNPSLRIVWEINFL